MPLLKAFNRFASLSEPISPTMPNAFYWELIAIRARKVLATRTEKQVHGALTPLNKALQDGLKLEAAAATKALSIDSCQSYPMSDTNTLRLYISNTPPKEHPPFPKATWGEYFAILALTKMGSAISSCNSDQDKLREKLLSIGIPPKTIDSQQEVFLNQCLQEATEAISAAETFANSLIEAKLETKKANSRGGKKRGAYYSQLKDFVQTTWEERYQDISNRQAAKRIWLEVPEAQKLQLTTDDPEHTLEIWIGKYKNKKISAKST